MSWIFAFFGVISKSVSSFTGISMLIIMPLTFLSNAYVPVNTFPKVMRWIANANPVTHLVTAVRQLTNHGLIGTDFWLSLAGAIVFILIFAPLTLRAYMKKA
jgi:ABC-2 type transport system permease protein